LMFTPIGESDNEPVASLCRLCKEEGKGTRGSWLHLDADNVAVLSPQREDWGVRGGVGFGLAWGEGQSSRGTVDQQFIS
jgi:hypothetical protein